MKKLLPRIVSSVLVGCLLVDPALAASFASPRLHGRPATDTRCGIAVFREQAVVPALLRVHAAFSGLTFRQFRLTASLLAGLASLGELSLAPAQTASATQSNSDSMMPAFGILIGTYFVIKALGDLSRAGYRRTSAALSGLTAILYSGLMLDMLADFSPLSLSSWTALYLRLSIAAPLGVPVYGWLLMAGSGIGAYELWGWRRARMLNHRHSTGREFVSGERRFVVYTGVRQVMTSSTIRRKLRRALIVLFAGLALLTGPSSTNKLARWAEKNEAARNDVKAVLPQFAAVLPQRNPMHNAGSYFLANFSQAESKQILGQKTARFSLQALDGRDVRHFKIWVHSRGGQSVNILSAYRVGERQWITDRDRGPDRVASNSMKDVFIDMRIETIEGYLTVLNLIQSKSLHEYDLAVVSVEVNGETGLTYGSTVSAKAQVKLEAYTDAGQAGLTPSSTGSPLKAAQNIKDVPVPLRAGFSISSWVLPGSFFLTFFVLSLWILWRRSGKAMEAVFLMQQHLGLKLTEEQLGMLSSYALGSPWKESVPWGDNVTKRLSHPVSLGITARMVLKYDLETRESILGILDITNVMAETGVIDLNRRIEYYADNLLEMDVPKDRGAQILREAVNLYLTEAKVQLRASPFTTVLIEIGDKEQIALMVPHDGKSFGIKELVEEAKKGLSVETRSKFDGYYKGVAIAAEIDDNPVLHPGSALVSPGQTLVIRPKQNAGSPLNAIGSPQQRAHFLRTNEAA